MSCHEKKKKKPERARREGVNVGLHDTEREWRENGRWRKTEGKRERSVNSDQRSRAPWIE